MKAFQGKPVFPRRWKEDLENCVNIFNTLATICEVIPEDKFRAIPVTLKADALNYFANNSAKCADFEEAIGLLRAW